MLSKERSCEEQASAEGAEWVEVAMEAEGPVIPLSLDSGATPAPPEV